MFLKVLLDTLTCRRAKMSRVEVFKKLRDEREYQQSRWDPALGTREYGVCETRLNAIGQKPAIERYHELGAWISFMETYLQEARNLNSKGDDLEQSLLKVRAVGALAVAALEQHGCPDRPGWPPATEPTKVDKATTVDGPAYHGDRGNASEKRLAEILSEVPHCGNHQCPVHGSGGIIEQLKNGELD